MAEFCKGVPRVGDKIVWFSGSPCASCLIRHTPENPCMVLEIQVLAKDQNERQYGYVATASVVSGCRCHVERRIGYTYRSAVFYFSNTRVLIEDDEGGI